MSVIKIDGAARKLGKICNLVDENDFAGALQMCQDNDIQFLDAVKAIIAYCYIRLNKVSEGLAIARQIRNKNVTDDLVLYWVGKSFQYLKLGNDAISPPPKRGTVVLWSPISIERRSDGVGSRVSPSATTEGPCTRRQHVLRYPDGTVYEGDVQGQVRQGRGKMVWPCGDEYEGSWAADKVRF